jgi:hypothetical protein
MMDRFRIFLPLLILAMTACSTPGKNLRSPEDTPQQPAADRQQSALNKKVAVLLEKKMYRQALETLTRRREPNHPPPGMEKEFITTINCLLEAGEDAMARNECLTAGLNFRAALEAYPGEPLLRKKVKIAAKRVKTHLQSCSARLMDQGVQEYRRGELDQAIRTWKGILSFDPGHKEARKAIETASIQKKSLQTLND